MISRGRIIALAIAVGLAYISWGLLLSLQPAFYPLEAELKGATPSQYGGVFGIVSLAAFLFSPIFAHFGPRIGPKILYNAGGFLQGITGIAFGALEFTNDTGIFIGLSYFLRFIDGVANAACSATIVSILMVLIPKYESSITAMTEMCLGLGYMMGPVLGSFLYTYGGFGLPFYVVGSLVILLAIVLLIMVPNVKPGERSKGNELPDGPVKPSLGIKDVLKSFSLSIPFLDNFLTFCGTGMIESLLQPHMVKSSAQATQFQVSMAFFIMAGCYMLTTPIVGYICDRSKTPIIFSILGNIFMLIAFLFIGPAPFFTGIPASVPLILGMMPFMGCGYGFTMVSSFSRAYKESMSQGFKDDIATYLVLTGLWNASFHFGTFFGPTVAGFIVNRVGFAKTSQISLFVFLIMTFADCFQYYRLCKTMKKKEQYEQLS